MRSYGKKNFDVRYHVKIYAQCFVLFFFKRSQLSVFYVNFSFKILVLYSKSVKQCVCQHHDTEYIIR